MKLNATLSLIFSFRRNWNEINWILPILTFIFRILINFQQQLNGSAEFEFWHQFLCSMSDKNESSLLSIK